MLVGSGSARPGTIEELMGPALLARLDRLDVLSRKVFAGKLPGERRSKRRGRSVEFDDYRSYVPGDDLRHIDWNVFARLDRFFVKLFREEEDLSFHIVVDASPSMDAGEVRGERPAPTKLVFAQRLAMSLAYIGLVNQNRVVLSVVGAPGRRAVQQLAPMRGRLNVQRAARFILDRPHPPEGWDGTVAGAAALGESLREVARSRAGKGVMVVLSDFLVAEDLRGVLNYLAGAGGGGFDTYLLQVLSPGELEPEREAARGLVGDLRLTDAESGRAAEVTVSPALVKRYKERLGAHNDALEAAATARGMGYMLVRTDADLDALLLGVLRREGLLG